MCVAVLQNHLFVLPTLKCGFQSGGLQSDGETLPCDWHKAHGHRPSRAEDEGECVSDYWRVAVITAGTDFHEEEAT